MPKAKRKIVTMIVEVSVMPDCPAEDARLEVRHALAGCYSSGLFHHIGMTPRSVKPAGRIIEAARKAWAAWGGGPSPRVPRETPPLLKAMGVDK